MDIPATMVDIHPKYKCFVHRDSRRYSPEIKNPHYYSHWNVSELSTGVCITSGRTRKEAIENATNKLKEVGDRGMEIAIKAYKERLTKYDLAAKGN